MKYFIDFEATQFSEEIISVGCIREDGETFYSLVAPIEGKITPFITNLTGITAEMLQDAMSPDHVFESFYDWAFANDDTPDFFVWGNSDVDFLRHTFRRTESRKARMAIGYMTGSIIDYAKIFCKRVKADSCALIKAYNGLVDAEKTQNHNALDDAVLLFEVYKAVSSMSVTDMKLKMQEIIVVNKPAAEPVIKWNQMGFEKGTICIINGKHAAIRHFANMDEAVEWILNNKINENQRETVSHDTIRKNIKRAYSGGKYFGHNWRIVV